MSRTSTTDALLSRALRPLNSAAAFRALNRAVKPAVRAGLFSPPPIGVGAVLLTTTGRQTGKARQVPVAAFRIGSRVYVSTVRGASHWMANLEAEPNAKIEFGGRSCDGVASIDQLGPLRVAGLQLSR